MVLCAFTPEAHLRYRDGVSIDATYAWGQLMELKQIVILYPHMRGCSLECDRDIQNGRCASCPFKSLFEKFDTVSDNDRSLFPSHELVPCQGLASIIVPRPLNLAYLRDRVVCRDIANLEMPGYTQRDHESRDELEIASIVGRVYSACYTASSTPGAISFDDVQSMYDTEIRIRGEALSGHVKSSKTVLKLSQKEKLDARVLLRHPDAPLGVCSTCMQNDHIASDQCDWKPVAGGCSAACNYRLITGRYRGCPYSHTNCNIFEWERSTPLHGYYGRAKAVQSTQSTVLTKSVTTHKGLINTLEYSEALTGEAVMGEWDSDASNHFTGTMKHFVTFTPRRMSVEVADGKFVQATAAWPTHC